MRTDVLLLTLVMALTTYLIRMLPMTLFRRKIRSRFAKRFFYYIPYAVLAAMLIPGVFFSTGNLVTALVGLAVGVLMSFAGRSLITSALVACLAAYLVGLIPF